jgi:hypothetical protein
MLQRFARRRGAAGQVGKRRIDLVEQHAAMQLRGLARRRLHRPHEDARPAFAKQLDAELATPAGQHLRRRQRRLGFFDL